MFIQVNCFDPTEPEVCIDGEKLTWDRNNMALKVVKLAATESGNGSLNLNDWKTISDATYTWEDWWIEDGQFNTNEEALPVNCEVDISNNSFIGEMMEIFPNPVNDRLTIKNPNSHNYLIEIVDLNGKVVLSNYLTSNFTIIDLTTLDSSLYLIKIYNDENIIIRKVIKY